MVEPEERERTAGRSGEEPDSMPAAGYARLSLVRLRAWQIPLVLVILICVSFLLFPRERMLIDFHLERGRMDDALDEISDMLAKDPDNPELLKLAVETRVLLGDMDEAIRLQERAVRIDPSPAGWRRLAMLFEWNRNPRAALKAYEEAASVDPGDKEALEKVIGYARYLGKADEVGRAVARLVEIEDITDGGQDPLARELTEALNALAEERRTKDPDPLLDDLLGRLYLVRSDYLSDLGEGKTAGRGETVRAALEGFLMSGRLERGSAFARLMDNDLQTGMTFRLAWVDFLRWNGLTEQALAMVMRLQEGEPESAKIARLVAELAGQTEDISLLVRSLEGRLRLEPESVTIKAALADLYRASGDTDRAFRLYKELYRDHPKDRAYLNALLETAEASDDPALKERAADQAGTTRSTDPNLLQRRADLYLAAENPKKAWPLLSELAAQSRGEREAVRTMIQAAGYTNDPALMKKALNRALALRPADQELRREAADMFLWTDGAEASFQVLLKAAKQRGATRADVFRLIELAGYTGRPEPEREALALAAVRLRGPDVFTFRKAAPPYTVPASDSEALSEARGYLARQSRGPGLSGPPDPALPGVRPSRPGRLPPGRHLERRPG